MKTIVNKENSMSLYLFEDSMELIVTDQNITVGNPPEFIIGDCNSNNTIIYTNITAPDDWFGCKYFFDGTTWTINPDYVSPEPTPIPTPPPTPLPVTE
jgi:hypothetical protein